PSPGSSAGVNSFPTNSIEDLHRIGVQFAEARQIQSILLELAPLLQERRRRHIRVRGVLEIRLAEGALCLVTGEELDEADRVLAVLRTLRHSRATHVDMGATPILVRKDDGQPLAYPAVLGIRRPL